MQVLIKQSLCCLATAVGLTLFLATAWDDRYPRFVPAIGSALLTAGLILSKSDFYDE